MGERVGRAKLLVNLHIAIYIVIQWAAKGHRWLGAFDLCTGRRKHKMWTGGGSAYCWVIAGASHFVVGEVGY